MAHIAVKKLTKSDLSFFEQHVRESKQKGVNLNSDVFVELFYPGLRNSFKEIHFSLDIVGPGGKPRDNMSRKVLRTEGAKNWRLNGEVVKKPDGDPRRYDPMREDDYAILAFDGNECPEAVTMVLVSASLDTELHRAISERFEFLGRQTMLRLDQGQVASLIEATQTQYPEAHPLELLALPDSIEEATYGSGETQNDIARGNGLGAAMSPDALRRQLDASSEVGRRGEELFGLWLRQNGHDENTFAWVARDHARAAYDYRVDSPQWEQAAGPLHVDVKTTKGSFDSAIHMSMAEVRWAASNPSYRIARLFRVSEAGADVRILSGVHEVAKSLVSKVLPALSDGIKVDGFELAPSLFATIASGTVHAAEQGE